MSKIESQKIQIDNFKNLINNSGQIIAALDTAFNFLIINDAFKKEFKRVFGIKVGEGENLSIALAHLPQERENAVKLWSRALSGESYSIVHEFGDELFERKVYRINFTPLKDHNKKVYAACKILSTEIFN